MKTFNMSKNKGLLTEHLKYNHNLIVDVENFLPSDSQPLNNRIEFPLQKIQRKKSVQRYDHLFYKVYKEILFRSGTFISIVFSLYSRLTLDFKKQINI